MTIVDPQPLEAALDHTLATWHAETGQHPPTALFCAESHPLDESTLCRRLDGHSGTHQSDGTAAWVDVDEPDPDRWTTPTHDDARRTE